MGSQRSIHLVPDETQMLVTWVEDLFNTQADYFDQLRQVVRRLGAHYRTDGLTEVGFWVPEISGKIIQSQRAIYLEVFTPQTSIDFRQPEQSVSFQYDCVPLVQQGEFIWGVIAGMVAGDRDRAGSFYWLRYRDTLYDTIQTVRDIVPYSLPYGVFGPAELYNIEAIQQSRADLDFLQATSQSDSDEPPRIDAPTNILQIHVGTASAAGTLEGLTERYQIISDKLVSNEPLTPAEQNYVGYDAVQLLPTEPTIEYRSNLPDAEKDYFELDRCLIDLREPTEESGIPIAVTLRRPNVQNWGYDTPLLGSSATSPSLLGSLRPHEAIDFIATLHNFSQGPIHLIYDLVYGHADNQALNLISPAFLRGANMYGQDVNHQHPVVRAVLLEMQRRKINTGADGIRIDGGQDFCFFDPLSGGMQHDNAYLMAMSDVVQEIAGHRRLLFTIFEDGRPWPQEGWEESSTYRELIELRPESYQWGPLIFAHNTPTLKGFWDIKWRRVTEVMVMGDRWITGCGNHDTVRRGTQIATNREINSNLGPTLPEVIKQAYDNPATQLWVYGFSPGLPMDFLNALMRAAWFFFRNTDEEYGVKVVAEEEGFLDWAVTPEQYESPHRFQRLKTLGFSTYQELRAFMGVMAAAMVKTEYHQRKVVKLCQARLKGQDFNPALVAFLADLDVPTLRRFAMAFMEDGYEHCSVTHYESELDPQLVQFNYQLRQYRRQNPWLRENLIGSDRFNRINEGDRTLFVGLRTHPDNSSQQLVLVTHMGGDPLEATPADWLQLDLSQWKIAIATPGLSHLSLDEMVRLPLQDGEGILLESI